LASVVLFGCQDTAKADYGKCVALNAKGDTEAAWKACEEAVRMDATTESGKAATELLTKLKPAYEKAKADREAAETKAADEKRKADADAQAQAVALAKQKVEAKFWSFDRDGECTGHGWPPFRKTYEGGTFEEDELVALAAGCVHLFPGMRDPQLFTVFCCPR